MAYESLKEKLSAAVDAIVKTAVEEERLACMRLCTEMAEHDQWQYGANALWHRIDARRGT